MSIGAKQLGALVIAIVVAVASVSITASALSDDGIVKSALEDQIEVLSEVNGEAGGGGGGGETPEDETITNLTGYTWVGNDTLDFPSLPPDAKLTFNVNYWTEAYLPGLIGSEDPAECVEIALSNLQENTVGLVMSDDCAITNITGEYIPIEGNTITIWMQEFSPENKYPALGLEGPDNYGRPKKISLPLETSGTISFDDDDGHHEMSLYDGLMKLFPIYGMEAYTQERKWDEAFTQPIHFTGGADATNPDIIAWLEANGTLTRS